MVSSQQNTGDFVVQGEYCRADTTIPKMAMTPVLILGHKGYKRFGNTTNPIIISRLLPRVQTMVAAPVALPVLMTVIPNMQLARTRNVFGRVGTEVQIIER